MNLKGCPDGRAQARVLGLDSSSCHLPELPSHTQATSMLTGLGERELMSKHRAMQTTALGSI